MIYNVQEEEYETCRILRQNPRVIAYCTSPYEERLVYYQSYSISNAIIKEKTSWRFINIVTGMEINSGSDIWFKGLDGQSSSIDTNII